MDRPYQNAAGAVNAGQIVARALAPAKINLGLEIIGRRPDGFHEICTIMQTVSIFDRLTMSFPGSGRVTSDATGIEPAHNLVSIATREMAAMFDQDLDVDFSVMKRIPLSSGLGGGSSDAASTISLLARRWGIDPGDRQLARVAERVGSDVPFFLGGGRALVEGRGERIQPLPASATTWIVVIAPPIEIPRKTPSLYSALTPADFSDGSSVRSQATNPALATAARQNAFSRPFAELCSQIEQTQAAIDQLGSWPATLTGSGPAHYIVGEDFAETVTMFRTLRPAEGLQGHGMQLARTISGPGPIWAKGNRGRI